MTGNYMHPTRLSSPNGMALVPQFNHSESNTGRLSVAEGPMQGVGAGVGRRRESFTAAPGPSGESPCQWSCSLTKHVDAKCTLTRPLGTTLAFALASTRPSSGATVPVPIPSDHQTQAILLSAATKLSSPGTRSGIPDRFESEPSRTTLLDAPETVEQPVVVQDRVSMETDRADTSTRLVPAGLRPKAASPSTIVVISPAMTRVPFKRPRIASETAPRQLSVATRVRSRRFGIPPRGRPSDESVQKTSHESPRRSRSTLSSPSGCRQGHSYSSSQTRERGRGPVVERKALDVQDDPVARVKKELEKKYEEKLQLEIAAVQRRTQIALDKYTNDKMSLAIRAAALQDLLERSGITVMSIDGAKPRDIAPAASPEGQYNVDAERTMPGGQLKCLQAEVEVDSETTWGYGTSVSGRRERWPTGRTVVSSGTTRKQIDQERVTNHGKGGAPDPSNVGGYGVGNTLSTGSIAKIAVVAQPSASIVSGNGVATTQGRVKVIQPSAPSASPRTSNSSLGVVGSSSVIILGHPTPRLFVPGQRMLQLNSGDLKTPWITETSCWVFKICPTKTLGVRPWRLPTIDTLPNWSSPAPPPSQVPTPWGPLPPTFFMGYFVGRPPGSARPQGSGSILQAPPGQAGQPNGQLQVAQWVRRQLRISRDAFLAAVSCSLPSVHDDWKTATFWIYYGNVKADEFSWRGERRGDTIWSTGDDRTAVSGAKRKLEAESELRPVRRARDDKIRARSTRSSPSTNTTRPPPKLAPIKKALSPRSEKQKQEMPSAVAESVFVVLDSGEEGEQDERQRRRGGALNEARAGANRGIDGPTVEPMQHMAQPGSVNTQSISHKNDDVVESGRKSYEFELECGLRRQQRRNKGPCRLCNNAIAGAGAGPVT
ncbi:hypothetical protein M427DRAFT_144097 [Gonapodya prolifera JEL478]|uniref:Uncharacterized protein n=1 Tax=Gonapodya prolifera (strain JEL478) TaxID=1344416 RepID=A0A139AMT2_GONPJ|nr:hypothetical protein M427DRAFT_144097 [Gonapodya prolifera JEL478]|eukprot:KXS18028.1 hypothetical protein M427DRAFT_144097 [Gonapodya prolifera JEL478]